MAIAHHAPTVLVSPRERDDLQAHWLLDHGVQWTILAGVDLVVVISAMVVSAFSALALDRVQPLTNSLNDVVSTAALGALWILALKFSGAYALRHLRAGALEYKRVINASALAAGTFGIACFLLNFSYPRSIFVLWIATGILGLVVARFARRRVMHRVHAHGMLQTPVVVAGSDHHVDEIALVLARERWIGYKVVGAVTREPLRATATGLPVLGVLADVVDVILAQGAHVVIFAEGSFTCPADFRRLAWKLEEHRVQMIVVPSLADISAGRLEFRPVAGLPFVDVARPRALRSLRWFKRATDIAGSTLLLVLFAPILLITAGLIVLEDRGPVIFRQRRVGLGGKHFDCLKFRSMCVDAEAKLAELAAANEGAGPLFKLTHDPRVTRVGRVIRRYSIDELPQLWNTLRGDMSLVGPRPALPSEVALYDDDTQRRLRVRPGLTGLWQVSGRSSLSWEDTVRLDLYYVDNWSMVQDLLILVKTLRAVVSSDGAY